jgi:hypothetical protein
MAEEKQNIPEEKNESIPSEKNKEDELVSSIDNSALNIPELLTTSKDELNPNNMEVHHHPDLHHKKKHFREYVLEFLMIFLAVTMGFIAENIREGITDHAKAKEYARSLYSDLKKDTAECNFHIRLTNWRKLKIDSLINILESGDVKQNERMIYYLNAVLKAKLHFKPIDATFQQLRSSGGFRYFENPEFYNLLTLYYQHCDFIIQEEKELSVPVPINFSAKLFRSDFLIPRGNFEPHIMEAMFYPAANAKLLTYDKMILNEYLSYVSREREVNNMTIFFLHEVIENDISKIITNLKKDYHFN